MEHPLDPSLNLQNQTLYWLRVTHDLARSPHGDLRLTNPTAGL